jgi:hypothetical protein
MTPQQHNQYLHDLASNTANVSLEKSILIGANGLLAAIKNRIQREGKDSSGTKMTGYSTKTAYYSKDAFVKKSSFKQKGKTKTGTFKNGKPRKSMFMLNGYKQLRETQGMPTTVRTINYSGDLMLSYVIGIDEHSVQLGFNQQKQSKKRKGLEEKNGGNIFSATNIELQDYNAKVIEVYKEESLKVIQALR